MHPCINPKAFVVEPVIEVDVGAVEALDEAWSITVMQVWTRDADTLETAINSCCSKNSRVQS